MRKADELIRILIQSQVTAKTNVAKTAAGVATLLVVTLLLEYALFRILN